MTGWWRDFGAARFGRPASPRPIVRPGLLARLDRAFADSTPSSTPHLTPEPGPGPERERDGESELVEGGVQPVVVVVAGSGAGKSTLLQQWAEPRGAVLVQLENGQVPAVGTGAVTVLDGVERLAVDGPEWRSIVKLVGVVPLVLSGREPIPVAAVDRLGAGHLEFAEDETYQVLAGALADAAGADRLAPDLHLLTGGWPALVGLAAAWLARLPVADRGASLRQLARVDGPLRDHLVGVLLQALHHDEREFVRRLAHLPAIDAATADALDLTEDLGGLPPIVLPVYGKGGRYGVPEPLRETIQQRLPLAEPERRALLEAFQGM
ncbi:hypothetical protein ACFPIJ_23410 [Dactylosporangium cerinum]|uniref:Uncharacterized protein n=1 Tax=Dactylosporangium cerinum TaxID=1434730 RepID=A0ABV9VYG0_9ACTN